MISLQPRHGCWKPFERKTLFYLREIIWSLQGQVNKSLEYESTKHVKLFMSAAAAFMPENTEVLVCEPRASRWFLPFYLQSAPFIFSGVSKLCKLLFALSKFSWPLNVRPGWRCNPRSIPPDKYLSYKQISGDSWLRVSSALLGTVKHSAPLSC